MTDAELDELLTNCPKLYHMAAAGSWPGIKKRGLLSTTALLDLYGVSGTERRNIEAERRPKSVALSAKGLPKAFVRDQLPMDDKGLVRCLTDGLSPTMWYRLLNGRVFFWLTRERLLRLLNAGVYQSEEHDVLELSARALVAAYKDRIWLCPMNSGSTKPFPHSRGKNTFARISDYPYTHWKAKRTRGERVVELAVDYAVPDVANFVTAVRRMKAGKTIKVLFSR